MVRCNPGTSRLDFGGDPDLVPDSGIFRRNFTIAVLATVKALHHGFGNKQSENMQASGPQIERI